MGGPVLGRVRDVRTSIREGDLLLLDASAGALHVRPTPAVQEAFDAKLELSQKRRANLAVLRDLPAVTKRSEEHTSELQSLMRISYTVFCLKKKKFKLLQG